MAKEFIAVDWGTSNRRSFRIGSDGSVLDRQEDDQGILSVSDFPVSISALRGTAGDTPLLLAGMVGSNRGWIEAPYATAPAGLAAIAAATLQPQPGVFLAPGVLFDDPARPDIMRGEEVQFIGALALGLMGDGLVCHPGTHSKWVEVEDGQIARFRTVMTGDIFAALKSRSILSDILAHDLGDDPAADTAFIDGVDHALDNPDLGAELFSARARVVTGRMTAAEAAARISGLLIGADVRTGLGRLRADVVPLIGALPLCRRFAVALERAGRESVIIDGEAAFVAGARALMGRLGAIG
jgi:2-dehydro-3-deoxygalactonokinase